MTTLLVPSRFRGPQGSGNGGWTSGALAALLGAGAAPVTVRLRRPPPLDRPLEVRTGAGDDGTPTASAWDGEHLVAEAGVGTGAEALDDLAPVTPLQARDAEAGYAGALDHPFPGCFVCGTAREPGDGLRLRPGPVAGTARSQAGGTVACTWTAPGDVDGPVTWAALDCPGAWAVDVPGRQVVLGTMTAQVLRVPAAGEACVVVGRALRTQGRKAWTATAVRGDDGEVLARAAAVWLQVDAAAFVRSER